MKKILLILLLFPTIVLAEDITKTSTIVINNTNINKLRDNNENTYITIKKGNNIKITHNEDIYGIYIIYEAKAIKGKVSNYTREIEIGTEGYLHEYLNIEKIIGHSKELELSYDEDVKIGEIYILSKGTLPGYVEVWNEPCKEADLLLFSTHSDDEHLFFAGLLPTSVSKAACSQVVYFTNHNDNPKRLHEQIHGLYKVGIRNYPVIGFIPDEWSNSLEWAAKNLNKAGYIEDDALKFEVEIIRQFKPQVVVGHDELGEYSHGQHILNTYILKKAIELANDETYDLDSIKKYGLWNIPKTYLHLYNDNKIIMNYDIPLEYFDGKTAFEMSKIGFKEHYSQQFTWFTKWLTGVDDKGEGISITKANQITEYSPCEFGLYRTTVGEDVNKNDIFENITLRKDIVKNEDVIVSKDIKEPNMKISITNYTIYIYLSILLLTIIIEFLKIK